MPRSEVVILGAGQAGLALSARLAARGIDHVLVERGRVGERWRAERWDSLRLLTHDDRMALATWLMDERADAPSKGEAAVAALGAAANRIGASRAFASGSACRAAAHNSSSASPVVRRRTSRPAWSGWTESRLTARAWLRSSPSASRSRAPSCNGLPLKASVARRPMGRAEASSSRRAARLTRFAFCWKRCPFRLRAPWPCSCAPVSLRHRVAADRPESAHRTFLFLPSDRCMTARAFLGRLCFWQVFSQEC